MVLFVLLIYPSLFVICYMFLFWSHTIQIIRKKFIGKCYLFSLLKSLNAWGGVRVDGEFSFFQTNHSSFCAVVTIVVDVVVWDKLGSNCLIFNKSLDAKCVGVRWPSTIFVVCTRVCSQGDASFPTTMPLCVNAIYAWISLIHSCRLLLI